MVTKYQLLKQNEPKKQMKAEKTLHYHNQTIKSFFKNYVEG
jgi:hypothetical protein